MKRISIKQAILDLIEETDPTVNKSIPLLVKWGKRLESRIGTPRGYNLRFKLITAVNNTIPLPDEAIIVQRVYKGDFTDQEEKYYKELSGHIIETYEIDGAEYYWASIDGTDMMYEMLWEEWGNEIRLLNDYDGYDFTVIYSYIELDNEGFPIVNESHIEAIKLYLKYKLVERMLWGVFKSNRMLRNNMLAYKEELKRDYKNEVRNARALDSQENIFEKEQYQ